MKRILLTGAEGFLGKLMSLSLQKLGHQIIHSTFDIRDKKAISTFMTAQEPIDLTIHLAAMSSVPECEKNPTLAQEINVQGSLNLACQISSHSPHSRFAFFSSAQVYDWSQIKENERASEFFPVSPATVYAKTKFEAEKQLSEIFASKPSNLILLRLFNHSHCTQSPQFFLPSVYQQILKAKSSGQVTLSLGETMLFRDIGAVQDLLSAVEALVEKQWNSRIYNICSGSAKKLSDLISELSKALEVKTEIVKNPQFIRKHDPPWICGSYDSFQRDFGWKPTYGQSSQSLISAFLAQID